METSGFRPEHHHNNHNHQQSHVPQQSRRDKLRVQQVLTSTPISHHHLSDHSSLPSAFIDQSHHHHQEFALHQDPNLHNARNFLYNQDVDLHHRPMSITPGSDVPQSFMLNWPASAGVFNASQPGMASLKPGQLTGQRYYLEGMSNNSDQVVTVASTRDVIRSENELALLPFSFGNNLDPNNWMKRTGNVNDVDQTTTVVNDRNLQGLSLSLSSINPHVAQVVPPDHSPSSDSDRELPKPVPNKPSIIGKGCGKSLQDIVGVGVSSGSGYNNTHRSSNVNAGPLGPFTGYATILKSSRFLKPAQQLLEEFCGSKIAPMMMNNKGNSNASNSNEVSSERLSDVSTSVSAIEVDQSITGFRDHHHHNNRQVAANLNSCASSSTTFYGSSEMNGGDRVSFESRSSRPEHVHHRKAKLLYMQEEVSRRYKQYRQQMQMVVSSFESVAGLSSATPYISLALKAVSKHFRSLKTVIADQLSHTRRALGEDFLSPTAGKGPEALRLKYNMEQQQQVMGFQKHGPMFHEPPQHHVWRPQRGLPERSVAVLRAWLFEHFLHPYPTDTDKHMLANQTGLTRNQVSNWFINARVRVWKPMVEEIHTLETKGTSAEQGNVAGASSHDASDQQSHEKRSRLEFGHQASAAAAVVQGFVPYHNHHHRSGLEVWTRAEQ